MLLVLLFFQLVECAENQYDTFCSCGQLRQLAPRALNNLFKKQRKRWNITLSDEQIQESKGKAKRFKRYPLVFAAFVECQLKKFKSAWNSFAHRYKRLHKSVYGLSTVLTGTTNEMFDTSFTKYETRAQHNMLSSIFLAGILHAKPWYQVGRVCCPKLDPLPW